MSTQPQFLITEVLVELHFEYKSDAHIWADAANDYRFLTHRWGDAVPEQYIVTDDTLAFLKDKIITIDPDGECKVS